jgi:hypothetical protein
MAGPLFIISTYITLFLAVWALFTYRHHRALAATLFGLFSFADSWLRAMQVEPSTLRPESTIALIWTMAIMGIMPLVTAQAMHQAIKVRIAVVFALLPLLGTLSLLLLLGSDAIAARGAGVVTASGLILYLLAHNQKLPTTSSVIRKRDTLVVTMALFAPASLLRVVWPATISTAYSTDVNTLIAILDLSAFLLVLALSVQEWPLNILTLVKSVRLPGAFKHDRSEEYLQEDFRADTKSLNRIADLLGAPVALVLPGQTVVSDQPHNANFLAQIPRATVAGQGVPLSRCYFPGPSDSIHERGYIAIQLWEPPVETENTWVLVGAGVYKRYNTYLESRDLLGIMQAIRDRALQEIVLPRLQITEQQARIGRLKARATTLQRQETDMASANTETEIAAPAQGEEVVKNTPGILAQYLGQFERRIIELSLQTTNGVVNAAATLIGVDKVRISRLMRRYQISHENYRARRSRKTPARRSRKPTTTVD